MLNIEIIRRCQNCGSLKREHATRKPWRCATRLKVSYWQPWTVAAYEAAVAAGKRAAGVPQEEESDAAFPESCWACGNILGLCICVLQEEL